MYIYYETKETFLKLLRAFESFLVLLQKQKCIQDFKRWDNVSNFYDACGPVRFLSLLSYLFSQNTHARMTNNCTHMISLRKWHIFLYKRIQYIRMPEINKVVKNILIVAGFPQQISKRWKSRDGITSRPHYG